MSTEQEKSIQERQAEAIVVEALEQIESKEIEIAHPPGEDAPIAALTPNGFPRVFKPVEPEGSRVDRLEKDILDIKAETLFKVDEAVKELPDNDQKRIKEGTTMVLYPQQDVQQNKNEHKQHKDLDRSQEFALSVLAESYREKNLSQRSTTKSKDQTLREMNFPQFYQSLPVQQGYGQQKQQVNFSKETFEISGNKIEEPGKPALQEGKETKQIEAPQSREEQFMNRIGAGEDSYSDREQLMSDFDQNRDDITSVDAVDIGEDLEPDVE